MSKKLTAVQIKKMTVTELKKICKSKGVKGYSKMKKAELVKVCLKTMSPTKKTKTPAKKTQKGGSPLFIPDDLKNIITRMTKEVSLAEVTEPVSTWYNDIMKTEYENRFKGKLSGYKQNEIFNELIKHGTVFFDYIAQQKMLESSFGEKTLLKIAEFDNGFEVKLFIMPEPNMEDGEATKIEKGLKSIIKKENLKYTKVDTTSYYIEFNFIFYKKKKDNGVKKPEGWTVIKKKYHY